MSDKKTNSKKIKVWNTGFILWFLNRYYKQVLALVLKNNGDEILVKKILIGSLLEYYYQFRNGEQTPNTDKLLNEITALQLRKNEYKKKNEVELDSEWEKTEFAQDDIATDGFLDKKNEVEYALKTIGEPGRTLLKLSFNDRLADIKIADHIHAETGIKLDSMRINAMDKFLKLLEYLMNESDKITLIKYILGNLSAEENEKLEKRLEQESDLKKGYQSYKKAAEEIDLYYTLKQIESLVNKTDLQSLNNPRIKYSSKLDKENTHSGLNWTIQLIVVIAVAVLVSWGYNYWDNKKEEKVQTEQNLREKQQQIAKEDSLKNAAQITKEELKRIGTDFTGVAISATGLYLAPYEITQNGSILFKPVNGGNKIPATILWDDVELGFSVLKLSTKPSKKLYSLPYRFSKKNFFLGEQIMLLFNNAGKLIYNYGDVIEDDPESKIMIIKMQLETQVLGAPVLNSEGALIGFVVEQDENGIAIARKTGNLFEMVREMNLNRGIEKIYFSSNNRLKQINTPEKIMRIKPFLGSFNVRTND